MDIQEYLVTLGVRPAELKGLKELPGGSKDRLTPLLLLAPWLATSPLSKSLDKFQESYPSRPYFLDIDTYYRLNDNITEAKISWAEIARSPANLKVWWDLLESYPFANPCILSSDLDVEHARSQVRWAREHNRIFCLRVNLSQEGGTGIPIWMPVLVEELAAEGANDYAVVIDFGWIRDPLLFASVATNVTRNFFSKISAEVPIAICCTSFPRDFTIFDGTVEHGFSNRALVNEVSRATNHPRIIYGDWGTTRPRSYLPASQPKNRIDYPSDSSWIFARDQKRSVDFKTAASRITSSPRWSGDLGIWGEQLIESTSLGQPFAIDSMPKMYAARINIHLHRQAFHGHLPPPEALDEEWSDSGL